MSSESNHEPPDNEILNPSLAERVRDLAVGRRTTSSHGHDRNDFTDASATTAFARLSSVSARHANAERASLDRCLQGMHRGRPLNERISAIKVVCHGLQSYSVDALRAIWTAVEDLTSVDASREAREASFELLASSASHAGLAVKERELLFSMIIPPIPASDSKLQILALRRLTQDGSIVMPFRKEFAFYLVNKTQDVFDATLEARSASKKDKIRRPILEHEVLAELLSLIRDVVDRNPTAFERQDLGTLVQKLIFVANRTTARKDLNQVAFALHAITSHSSMPPEHLEACIEVLCGISGTADASVGEATWSALKNLLATPDQSIVVDVLLNILLYSSKEKQGITLRGALLLIKHIVEKNASDEVPVIDIQKLLSALQMIAPSNSRLQVDSLEIVISCLENNILASRLLTCNWSFLDAVIYRADYSPQTTHPNVKGSPTSITSPFASFERHRRSGTFTYMQDSWKILRRLAFVLDSHWPVLNISQRALALGLILLVGYYVDKSLLGIGLDHIVEDGLVVPPTEDWAPNLNIILEAIACDTEKPWALRLRVLTLVAEVVQNAGDQTAKEPEIEDLVKVVLEKMGKESEVILTNVLVQLLVQHALHAPDQIFEAVLAFTVSVAGLEGTTDQPVQNIVTSDAQTNHAATHLVWLFQQCLMRQCSLRTKHCFNALLTVASDTTLPTGSRLTTMKLLSRLRCNFRYELRVLSVPDTLGLAAALCRTEASAQADNSGRGNPSRASVVTESPGGRTGRSSAVELSRSARSRSTTRSGSGRDRSVKATPPLWMYPGSRGLPIDPSLAFSKVVSTYQLGGSEIYEGTEVAVLEIERWLDLVLDILQHGSDWEIYSYILVHLPSQLTNMAFFAGRMAFVQSLHRLILTQLRIGSFHEPPASTGVKKGDVALCLYNAMTVLLAYQEHLGREQLDETVRVFCTGIGMWERAAKSCIHALALCSHEIPTNLRRSLLVIIQKMAQIITQSHLAVDILEFLAGLVRLPEAYQIAGPESQDILRTIFGICISYIHHAREQREKSAGAARSSNIPARHSGLSNKSSSASESSQPIDVQKDLPEYVFTLAYHVVTFWFLAIDIKERSKHVSWIVKNLTWKDDSGNESMEEQSQVTLDMIHRTAYNDLGETQANVDFHDAHGPITKEIWLVGMSIISLETVQQTGLTLITKRQASGTTHAMYQQYTAQLPPHHVPLSNANISAGADVNLKVFPQHVLLQLGFTIAPVPIPLQPILLPEDDFIKRAISSFDRNDTVDGHKAGVIYIAPEQSSESSILANVSGSKIYEDFLSRLGTKVPLQDAKFNTQGLDRESDLDGTQTYAWRDRVTEIVFHVTTMMPTLDHDPQCTNKKRHVGNDYIKIIFNESGLPFRLETFASQFNHVNIVITPEFTAPRLSTFKDINTSSDTLNQSDAAAASEEEPTAFFTVQTLCSSSFPQTSPTATPKVVSAAALPSFVRQLALNASVLSLVWSNQREGGENLSSWRNRLKEIIKLRQRYANTGNSANVSYPGMGNPSNRGGAPSYVDGDSWTGRLTMAGMVEQEQFLYSADFTRWN